MINSSVLQIVYQHHETIDGEGYPNKLSGVKIFPLAKVVNLADAFSDFLQNKKITPKVGISCFTEDEDRMKKYDISLVKALIAGFEGK